MLSGSMCECVRECAFCLWAPTLSPVSPWFLFMQPSGPGPTGCARLVVTQHLAWLLGHSCHAAVARCSREAHKILRAPITVGLFAAPGEPHVE